MAPPAICSTTEALKEVCGDLALYFEPDDAIRLSQILENLGTNTEFQHELRNRINEARPILRTWNAVAHETLASMQALR